MTERSTGERLGAELPPGWTAIDASTATGHLYVAVWRAFPDATRFEHECALAPLPGQDLSWLRAGDAVARVGALREARGGRLDLPEDVWRWCIRLVYPTLSEQERQNPNEILTAIAALRPDADGRDDNTIADHPRGLSVEAAAALAPRKPGRPAWTRGLFEEHWERAYRLTKKPKTIPRVAAHFEALDGYSEIAPKTLSRLRHKHEKGALPE
jgi:hypothetical protein